MARVTHVKKAQKAQGTCEVCHAPIEVGQPYKWCKPRSHRGAIGYKRKRHEGCRSWRPSETTSSGALAEVYAAQEAAEDALAAWDRETWQDLADILDNLAEGLRAGAEVWRESASNIEAGFGHATSMSEELEGRADDLESQADDLDLNVEEWDEEEAWEDAARDASVDLEGYDRDADPEGLLEAVEAAREEWATEADAAVSDLIQGVEIP